MHIWRSVKMVMASALVALPLAALAGEALVKMDGDKPTPGVVTAWSGSGTKVELTVKDGADAKVVADAIQAGVDKVKAKVQGGKVVVTGKPQDELLKALAGVELGGEDIGALAQAAAGTDDAGSSLRAKKAGDLAKLFADQATTLVGKVTAVEPGKFPEVVVTVQVLRAPSGPEANTLRKGAKIKFKPVYKMKGSAVELGDEDTQQNLGAYYLRANDQVRVKFGKSNQGTYEAIIIDRS